MLLFIKHMIGNLWGVLLSFNMVTDEQIDQNLKYIGDRTSSLEIGMKDWGSHTFSKTLDTTTPILSPLCHLHPCLSTKIQAFINFKAIPTNVCYNWKQADEFNLDDNDLGPLQDHYLNSWSSNCICWQILHDVMKFMILDISPCLHQPNLFFHFNQLITLTKVPRSSSHHHMDIHWNSPSSFENPATEWERK